MRFFADDRRRATVIASVVLAAAPIALFWPVVSSGRLLAVGDAVVVSVPYFQAPRTLWEPLILLGFPLAASPYAMLWYPFSALGLLPNTWNIFIIAAYLVAAFGTFAYVRAVTASNEAALISATSFAFGGFMIAHLGHVSMLHAAAWVPLMIFAVEMLIRAKDARWICLLAATVALTFLAGFPQVFVYAVLLASAYGLANAKRAKHPRRFLAALAAGFVLGVGLSGVQLLPEAQLAQLSVRQHLDFDMFITYAVPLSQLPVYLFFPYFFGEGGGPIYAHVAHFGNPWNFAELTQYSGVVATLLAAAALGRWRADSIVRFWSLVAAVCVPLVVGNDLWAATITYHVPVLNLFRAPARHALEFTFAVAVLAGIGYQGLAAQLVDARKAILAAAGVVAALFATLFGIVLAAPVLRAGAAAAGIADLPLSPFANASLGIPCALALAALVALAALARRPASRARRAALLILVAADAWTFADGAYWQFGISTARLAPPPDVPALRAILDRDGSRMVSVRGARAPTELPPELSLLWGLRSATGYDSLEPERVANFLASDSSGELANDDPARPGDSALDLAAVRFAVTPPPDRPIDPANPLDGADLVSVVGTGAAPRVQFRLPAPVQTNELILVTAMQNSPGVPGGAPVCEVTVSAGHAAPIHFPLVAGRDTAEVAYDRPDVRGVVRHPRATIFTSAGGANFYQTTFTLPKARGVTGVTLRWTGPSPASLVIRKIALVNGTTRQVIGLTPGALLGSVDSPWAPFADRPEYSIFQNRHPVHRDWVVPRTIVTSPAQALQAVHTGVLPDGARFDPRTQALIEDPVATIDENAASLAGEVRVVHRTNDSSELAVSCRSRCFLVTSDAYYPGWTASVDGTDVTVRVADYALRGIPLASGPHRVLFRFHSRAFELGLGLSGVSFSICALLLIPAIAVRLR